MMMAVVVVMVPSVHFLPALPSSLRFLRHQYAVVANLALAPSFPLADVDL